MSVKREEQQTALIVDDDITNLMVLSKFLEKLGYDVIEAKDGIEAINAFKERVPDIIFMDIMMPEMNGYEATTQIKQLCGPLFVPIIFLTALNSPEDLVKGIEAGGDDFLTKPLDLTILRAKIQAVERIRNVYRQVQDLNATLNSASEIANKAFHQAVFTQNLKTDAVKMAFQSHEHFNNDLFLISRTPSNGINILFGHFNAQGLTSAVGALPASEVFRTMTRKGFAPHNIVQRINAKLYGLLPDGISLSMIFINLNESLNRAIVCNFNMPDIYFINQDTKEIFFQQTGENNTIGATPRYSRDLELNHVNINKATTIIMNNSALFKLKNKKGEQYSEKSYINAINKGVKKGRILETIKNDTDAFITTENKKSTNIIEILCGKELIPQRDTLKKEAQEKKEINTTPCQKKNNTEFSFHISADRMKEIDPVPLLLNSLESVINIEKHQRNLFTILTELYMNALDHGILQLDSALKSSAEGFNQFYQLREKGLQELVNGHIKITISINSENKNTCLGISIEDSGNGFDTSKLNDDNNTKNAFSGRGIMLLKSLCNEVSINEKGNQTRITYAWC